MNTVTAPDGTTIAYDRTGAGDPLVLIGGAFSYRRFPGQWAAVTMPALVMCGVEKETPPFMRHAAAAVAAALPNARLIERRGLGHTKKLTPKVIAAALTEFLAGHERNGASPAPGTSDPGPTSSARTGDHHD